MEITRKKAGPELEMKLSGRLDASWSEFVTNAVAESMRNGEHRIALDMAEVSYISSAGIRVLMQAYKQLRGIDGAFRVIHPSAAVRSTLQLSGLAILFEAQKEGAKEVQAEDTTRVVAGIRVDVHDQAGNGSMLARVVGSAGCTARQAEEAAERLSVEESMVAVGFGALGQEGYAPHGYGEFLAVAGAACALAGEAAEADYLVQQERFVPSARLAHGIVGRGDFSLQFGFNDEQPLSIIARAAVELCGHGACALAMIAETAWLAGAAMKRWCAGTDGCLEDSLLAYPAIKDTISFTVEPAHADTVALVAGFAARDAGLLAGQLKPLVPERDLFGHLHAVVFPYAPLRKGRLELAESVRQLFSGQTPRGMMHLVNDWRDCVGIGESRFVRGSCWCAPLSAGRQP